jgi:hypothetical protein
LDGETGLYFYRARYYDHTSGRFLQTDPIGISGEDNRYTYLGNSPTNYIDPLGLDFVDVTANYAAGFGDAISFGITSYVRDMTGANRGVDICSWGYSIGSWTGFFHGIAMGGGSLLNGGAKTVLYAGEGSLEAAKLAKASAKLLEDTLGGKLLKLVDQNVTLPDSVWKAASAIFAANAKGDVAVFARNARADSILHTVELPMLSLVNRVNSWIPRANTAKIVMR